MPVIACLPLCSFRLYVKTAALVYKYTTRLHVDTANGPGGAAHRPGGAANRPGCTVLGNLEGFL